MGAITYDVRILSYKTDSISIWSVDGRLKIPFVCHNEKLLPYIKGEADLIHKKEKFYLFQTVEVPEEDAKDIEDFICHRLFLQACNFLLSNRSICPDNV